MLGTRFSSPCWAYVSAVGLLSQEEMGCCMFADRKKYQSVKEDGGWDVSSGLPYHCTLVWSSLWDLHRVFRTYEHVCLLYFRVSRHRRQKAASHTHFPVTQQQRFTRQNMHTPSICSEALSAEARSWTSAAKPPALQTETLCGNSTVLVSTDTFCGVSERKLTRRRHAPGSPIHSRL